MKLTKLVFECEDFETGKKYTRVLEHPDDVKQWTEWMLFVCQYADEAGVNPSWHDLNWVQTEVNKPRTRNKNKLLLTQIIENSNEE